MIDNLDSFVPDLVPLSSERTLRTGKFEISYSLLLLEYYFLRVFPEFLEYFSHVKEKNETVPWLTKPDH